MPIDLSTPEVGSAWSKALRRTARSVEAKTGLKGIPRGPRRFLQVRRGGSAVAALHGAEIGCEEWVDDDPLTLGRRGFLRRQASRAGKVVKTVATTAVNPIAATRAVANITSDVTRAAATTAMDVSRGNFDTAFVSAGSLMTKTLTAPAVLAADTVGYGKEARNLVKEYDFGAWMQKELLSIIRRLAREMIEAMGSAKSFTLGGLDERGMDWVYKQRNKVISTVAAGIGAKVTAATAEELGPYSVAAGAASAALSTDISKGIIEEYREQMAKTRAEREAARIAREAAEKEAKEKVNRLAKEAGEKAQKAASAGHAAAGRAQAEYVKTAGANAASSASKAAQAAGRAQAAYYAKLAKSSQSSLGTPLLIAGAAVVAILVMRK